MMYQTPQHGFSLIETLVAIAILLIAIVGPLAIVSRSFEGAVFARQQVQASFLAQEGLELIYLLRNQQALEAIDGGDAWGWTDDDSIYSTCFEGEGCGLYISDGSIPAPTDCTGDSCVLKEADDESSRSQFIHGGDGDPTPYTRAIKLEEVTSGELKVTSEVTFSAGLLGRDQTTTVVGYLYNIY